MRWYTRARLIEGRQYVLDSDWGDVQPDAEAQNALPRDALLGRLRRLAPRADRGRGRRDEGAVRLRRTATSAACTAAALIACVYRASEWRHKEVELAAHDLLQLLDATSA